MRTCIIPHKEKKTNIKTPAVFVLRVIYEFIVLLIASEDAEESFKIVLMNQVTSLEVGFSRLYLRIFARISVFSELIEIYPKLMERPKVTKTIKSKMNFKASVLSLTNSIIMIVSITEKAKKTSVRMIKAA